jgi:hypothetical protein
MAIKIHAAQFWFTKMQRGRCKIFQIHWLWRRFVFSLLNQLFFMLASVKKSLFFTLKLLFITLEGAASKKVIPALKKVISAWKKVLFFTLELLFFTLELLFFTLEKKPDLDIPRWRGA